MKKTILIGMGSLLLWSCSTPSEKPTSTQEVTTQEVTTQEVTTHEEHHEAENEDALALNDGQKWAVNKEMKPFVLKGEELVNAYMQSNQTDYKKLAKQVEAQNDKLIEGCTMDGKSHDELHKWLHPHLELTAGLSKENDAAKAKTMVTQLQTSYQTYHQYFN